MVRYADGRTENLVGAVDRLPDVPAGAEVMQDYPLGRMRMDKIGTGEGAQAYGYGLYNADSNRVAQGYRDTLTTPTATIDGSLVSDYARDSNSPRDAAINMIDGKGSVDNALQHADVMLSEGVSPDYINSVRAEIEMLRGKSISINGEGSLYRTELDVDPDTLLDWDKPLSEQPDNIKSALAPYMDAEGRFMAGGRVIDNPTGKQIYYNVVPDANDAAFATAKMQELGMPGIRYLDGDSRKAGEGSSNYVVFDDSKINIKERGMATPAALAVTAGVTGTGMALGGAGMLSANVPNAEGSTEEEPTFKERFNAASKASIAPESEWAAEFSPSDFRYAETYRGEDSPTGKTVTYINRKKFEDAGATEGYVDEIIFGETLHQLRDIDPERHKRLLDASRSEPEVMAWARDSYKRAQSEGEKRDFDSWWVNSRLDQVIGGYIQGGKNSSMPTMRGWDRDSLPYGTQFKGEIDNLMADLGRSFPADSSPLEQKGLIKDVTGTGLALSDSPDYLDTLANQVNRGPEGSLYDTPQEFAAQQPYEAPIEVAPQYQPPAIHSASALGEAFGATSRFIANKNPYVTALASQIDVGKEWDKPMARMYGLGAALKVLANGGTFENALLRGSKVGGQSIDEIGQELGEYVADKTGNPYAAAISKAIVTVASP
jgi:hypothetical protein